MIIYEAGKRLMDLALASVLTVLFLPLWAVIPILIKIDSKGKAIFSQSRIGKHGSRFNILKFRSMVVGADELLWKDPRFSSLRREFSRRDWKLPNDPRITRVGRILRRLSFDEFPQVFNVLRGEMSVVGPRAYRPQELVDQQKKYPGTKELIKKALTVKPGITGLWQVSGRNDVPFDKRVKIDAEYASRKSLWEDIMILLKTPKAMISKW